MDDVRLCGKSKSTNLCSNCADEYTGSNCNGSSNGNLDPNRNPYSNRHTDRYANKYTNFNSHLNAELNANTIKFLYLISNTTNWSISNIQTPISKFQ